ncbi:MAG TPA: CpsD/CapB family tyrosine-protein kinase [Anaerolineales bacterium]|nr:CpsD/CapB family tyrosine-protein kinase [Anaerolineales bacterium]
MQVSLHTLTDPASSVAEAYRTLRTNLMFAALNKPLQTLVLTSPTPDANCADKSSTIANLAVSFAQIGRKTILVDADLRRPKQHELWQISNERGLTSALLDGKLSLQNVGVENLQVLTSGPKPPNSADLLGSRKMEELLAQLKEQAEILLFDAPPVLAVSDTPILASKLDGILLAFTAGKTRRDHAQRAKELLEKANIRIVGTVLNNAPIETGDGGY